MLTLRRPITGIQVLHGKGGCLCLLCCHLVFAQRAICLPSSLGFVTDLSSGQNEATQPKIVGLRCKLECAMRAQSVRARHLASILGKIVFMSLALWASSPRG